MDGTKRICDFKKNEDAIYHFSADSSDKIGRIIALNL